MNVALYIRVSTQEQAKEGYSVGEQTERLQKYADAMRWNVYKIYTDPGFTGSNMERPALQNMIRDIKAGRIQKVIVYKLDRLSRSQRDTLELIEDIFLANDCDFVSMNENFDTSTPFGRAMIGILSVFAQLEREQIKERMTMGRVARAKEGKWGGGKEPPFGYDYEDGELKINDYEALQVRELYKLALTDISPYAITETMNKKGYRARAGHWAETSVRRILSSKLYIGYVKFGKEWHKGLHTPIIDTDTFEQVQKIMAHRKALKLCNQNPGKATSYLGGLLYCGCCGAKYDKVTSIKKLNGGNVYKYEFFQCQSRGKRKKSLVRDPNCRNRNWRMNLLTDMIFNEIKQLAIDPEYITVAKAKNTDPSNDEDKKLIKGQIDSLSGQISKLVDLYSIGNVPVDMIQEKIAALYEQKNSLMDQLQEMETKEDDKLTAQETIQLVNSFPSVLERGDFEEIRAVLYDLIEKIVLNGDDVTIFWRF